MYLKLDGTTTNEEGESLLETVKINLDIPVGAVFCNNKYGYLDFDVSDTVSVQENVNKIINRFNLNKLSLETVQKTSDSTVTVKFSGSRSDITLSTGV